MAASLTQSDIVEGLNIGVQTNLFRKTAVLAAGTPAADLAVTSLGTAFSGFLSAVRVLFGATAPSALTVTIKDTDGHTLLSESLSASGLIEIVGAPVFVNGLTIACAGNTTAGATATISIIYFT